MKDNFVPKLKISQSEINFKDLSYGDSQTVILDFVNEGDGLLEFEISKISVDSVISGGKNEFGSNCLSIEPLRGVIKAGEKVQITVKIEISHREAQLLFLSQLISETIGISTNEEN